MYKIIKFIYSKLSLHQSWFISGQHRERAQRRTALTQSKVQGRRRALRNERTQQALGPEEGQPPEPRTSQQEQL